MTTTLFLVRHAAHDNLGAFLAGRTPGIVLGEAGLSQANRLGLRMAREHLDAVCSSPRERTRQTAEAIISACGLGSPQIEEALDEVNFGDWTGKTFSTLDQDAQWRRWNTMRSLVRAPNGETMLDVQTRVWNLIADLSSKADGKRLALVSHGDVIKAAVSHILGLPIDAWPRFDVEPASVTHMVVGDWGAKIITLNEMNP
ncbi:histidine phosphatase family protein [Rhizobium sp. 11515TR]|jgi:broad specificity phosphatase PhoE|uniref:histidine phosphatase family protein n=1 Tax=unclassified Rhizobium TaxID=2613769 RepID=UPI000BA89F36|nr:histidine phosphatase family protein [Rhizobium sp. 11515TR]ASW09651.1 histidine phosphatase family protein [Rhizobium sp. 11515TR]